MGALRNNKPEVVDLYGHIRTGDALRVVLLASVLDLALESGAAVVSCFRCFRCCAHGSFPLANHTREGLKPDPLPTDGPIGTGGS